MNVLSLFDGASCGYEALKIAGIKVDKYYASEIDKYAIQVSKSNHQDIIHLGDVKNWREWNLGEIDLLIGGSPCQGFSLSGKQLNFKDPRSKLYFEFEDALNFYKPKYFLLENVKMANKYKDVISERLGVDPVLINSSLFSAQNRERYYWTNIDFDKNIKDRGIYLPEGYTGAAIRGRYNNEGKTYQRLETRKDRKSNCLTTVNKDSIYVKDGEKYNFSVAEKEWLQNLPKGYTKAVSSAKASKILGNGWTVGVISHIFSGLKGD